MNKTQQNTRSSALRLYYESMTTHHIVTRDKSTQRNKTIQQLTQSQTITH